jgi:hypothetical protein
VFGMALARQQNCLAPLLAQVPQLRFCHSEEEILAKRAPIDATNQALADTTRLIIIIFVSTRTDTTSFNIFTFPEMASMF